MGGKKRNSSKQSTILFFLPNACNYRSIFSFHLLYVLKDRFHENVRCLEDGAEEFFLKPVKLADMKKLKSHLLRRKQPQPQPQQKPEQAPDKPAEEAAAAEVTVSGSSKKRKAAAAMDQEGLGSPERTKPRLSSSSLAVET